MNLPLSHCNLQVDAHTIIAYCIALPDRRTVAMTRSVRKSTAFLECGCGVAALAHEMLAVGPTVFCNADLSGSVHIANPFQANFG
jgi:hypothetical protein